MSEIIYAKNTDALPFGVIEINRNRQIIYCNQYVLNLLSITSDEATKNSFDTLFTQASKIFINSYVFPILINEANANEIQLTLRINKQTTIHIVANIVLLEDGGSIWSFLPCENRNQLYDELIRARDTLSEQTQQLKDVNEQLEQKKEELEIFCYSLSHDFSGPLRRVNQFIDITISKLGDNDAQPNDAHKWLDIAKSQVELLTGLIDGLVEFITVENSDTNLRLIDLNDVIDIAVGLSVDQHHDDFDLRKDALPTIHGDKTQLQIIFKNLIGNGIKYNQHKPKITITADTISRQGYTIINIQDNGIGISTMSLDSIFDPFKRLHSDREYSGSGLGLSIVRKLMDKHHGDIKVTSIEGKGSMFSLAFPDALG